MHAATEGGKCVVAFCVMAFRRLALVLCVTFSLAVKDTFGNTVGSIDEGVDSEAAINRTGLFFLGNAPGNGTVDMLCAFGRINNDTQVPDRTDLKPVGRLIFFLYDEAASTLRRQVVQQDFAGEVRCRQPNEVNRHISDSELLFVYIEPRCAITSPPAGIEVHVCPLLVNFESEGSMTSTPYYNGSDIFEFTEIRTPGTFRSVIDGEPLHTQTFLNFNVSIISDNAETTAAATVTTTATTTPRTTMRPCPPACPESCSPQGNCSSPSPSGTDMGAVVAGVVPAVIIFVSVQVALICVGVYIWRRQNAKKAARVGVRNGFTETGIPVQHPEAMLHTKNTMPNFYHNFHQTNATGFLEVESAYYLAGRRGSEHDYEEPYFEPASEEEDLLQQLRKMAIPFIQEESKLKYYEVLGSGAFGTVHRGIWQNVKSGSSEKEVAVKTVETKASEKDRIKFLQEAAIMGQFNHPNIIRLLGVVTIEEKPLQILIEIMKRGDLRKHLHQLTPSPDVPTPSELAPTLLSYSRQIANGMMYLAVKSFVHRDLAARNVLVSDDGVCKIADFGLSRELQNQDFYTSHGGKIPVKWTAPEALHHHKYSTASDVWSYGCVLYEIWSLGEKPFRDITNREVMEKVNLGYRLPPPAGCPRAIYDVMIQCWEPEADKRPAFLEIMIPLQKPDFQVLKWSSEELTNGSKGSRTLGAPLEAGHRLHMDLQRKYFNTDTRTDSKCNGSGTQQSLKQNGTSAAASKDDGYEVENFEPDAEVSKHALTAHQATSSGNDMSEDSGYVLASEADKIESTLPNNSSKDNFSTVKPHPDSDKESGYTLPDNEEPKSLPMTDRITEEDNISTESGYAVPIDSGSTENLAVDKHSSSTGSGCGVPDDNSSKVIDLQSNSTVVVNDSSVNVFCESGTAQRKKVHPSSPPVSKDSENPPSPDYMNEGM